jgi:hypothetical protein
MKEFGRRELLALGLCTIATSSASAGGTLRVPSTIIPRSPTVHPSFTSDPATHSDPVTRPANDPTESTRLRSAYQTYRNAYENSRRQSIADLRAMTGLLVSNVEMQQIDNHLADPTIDGYAYLKTMLEGLIRARLQPAPSPEPSR